MPRTRKYGTPDEESPEWTAEDFAHAQPAKDFFAEQFVAEHAAVFFAENNFSFCSSVLQICLFCKLQ